MTSGPPGAVRRCRRGKPKWWSSEILAQFSSRTRHCPMVSPGGAVVARGNEREREREVFGFQRKQQARIKRQGGKTKHRDDAVCLVWFRPIFREQHRMSHPLDQLLKLGYSAPSMIPDRTPPPLSDIFPTPRFFWEWRSPCDGVFGL